jgi:hypothetical protein
MNVAAERRFDFITANSLSDLITNYPMARISGDFIAGRDSFARLLEQIFAYEPNQRPTMEQILNHEFWTHVWR